MAHIDVFKGWAETIRQDTEAFKALLESKQADTDARKLAGTALLYLVSRMDLIPDWNEGIGVIDDVMVLRVCAQLSRDHQRGTLPSQVQASLDRMAGEADKITQFLGGPLYDKLKAYCSKLGEQAVRGRTPMQLIEEEPARKALYVELEDEMKKSVPIVVNDPTDAELRLKAYLTHKLQA
ncbi:MAG TPA: YkvA family protein [Kofleriaceae bacterium]|nr:YkvA family protein [Kofleriaceae bacterium]